MYWPNTSKLIFAKKSMLSGVHFLFIVITPRSLALRKTIPDQPWCWNIYHGLPTFYQQIRAKMGHWNWNLI